MNINHFLKYSLGILLFLFLYACQSDTVYYTYKPISTDGWSKQDTLQFNFSDSIAAGEYNLAVGIRHSGKYAYRDLWLELTQTVPNTESPKDWLEKKDTIHIYLASEKGNWNGTGTTGGHFQLLLPVGSFIFPCIEENKDMDSTATDAITDTKISNKSFDKGFTAKPIRKKYTLEGKRHAPDKQTKHHLKIVHIMTDSVLQHITDVGIQLTGPCHKDAN